jgi:hypothetical protein
MADAPDQTRGLPSDVPTTPHEVSNSRLKEIQIERKLSTG